MPKAAVDKNHCLSAGEDNVGATWQGILQAVAKATMP